MAYFISQFALSLRSATLNFRLLLSKNLEEKPHDALRQQVGSQKDCMTFPCFVGHHHVQSNANVHALLR